MSSAVVPEFKPPHPSSAVASSPICRCGNPACPQAAPAPRWSGRKGLRAPELTDRENV